MTDRSPFDGAVRAATDAWRRVIDAWDRVIDARRRVTPAVEPERGVTRLAAAWPTTVERDPEVDRACRFLDAPFDSRRVTRASRTAAVLAASVVALAVSVAVAAGIASPLLAVVPVAVGVCVGVAGRRLPVWLAAFRRTRALGAATTVVGLAAARMRLDPVPERAARFAARTADGPLADALARAVAGARAEPTSGWTAFADRWSDSFPALDRAVAGLLAAAHAPPDGRGETLDRAVAAVADAVESRAAAFAADLRGPATALYAFGVLLPLALVAALPAAAVAGVPVTPVVLAVGYDLLLPVVVGVAGARLALARPVAFPPPAVADHPALPAWRRLAPLAGIGGAVVGWAVTAALAPWAAPVTAVGGGVGAALVVRYGPAAPIRRRVRELERGLPDALALVGRRVADGESVERAVAAAGERLSGPAGEAFAVAARRQRTLGVGIERAFRDGPFAHTPSPRAAGVARLLAAARHEGTPAGAVLIEEADRLDTLQRHERRARREVRRVTDTLANTAALFGPLVGGATVRLAGRLAESRGADVGAAAGGAATGGATTIGPATIDPSTIGPVVGCYVLWLAVLLPTVAAALERGLSRSLVGYRVGLATLSATASFLVGATATGFLV